MTILFLRSRSFAALAIGIGSAAAFAQTTSTIPAVSQDDRYSLGLVGRNLTNNYYLLYAPGVAGGTSVPLAIGEQRGVVARGRKVALQAAFKF